MKKLFAMATFAAAMIFGACTGNKVEEGLDFSKASADEVVSALAEKVQTGDATAINAAIETVQAQLSKLMEGTDVAKVSEYATKIKAFVEENAEALKNFNIDVTPLTAVIDQVAALPGAAVDEAQSAAEEAVEGAQEQVEGAVNEAVDAAQGAVNDAVSAGQKAVNDAVNAGQKAVNDAVSAGQKAVNDAANAGAKAVEDGKAKTNQAIQDAADKIKL